ncbi:MAG: Acetyltransferase family protein [Belnapia sp.]|nr:Acetyltransferase family protein [Belnapia sp.]
MILRPVTRADIPTLFEIRLAVRENAMTAADLAANGVTPAAVAAMLATTAAGWIADADAGFAIADAEDGSLFALFIRPACEGRGLGLALLRQAEAWLASQGWREAWLLTGADPALRAQRFYRAAGWRVAGGAPSGEQRFTRALSRPLRGVP